MASLVGNFDFFKMKLKIKQGIYAKPYTPFIDVFF